MGGWQLQQVEAQEDQLRKVRYTGVKKSTPVVFLPKRALAKRPSLLRRRLGVQPASCETLQPARELGTFEQSARGLQRGSHA